MESPGRHEQLLRIFHLVDLLSGARVPLSAPRIKEELRDRGVIDDMSDRNIRRDVAFLIRFGYDVREEMQPGGRGGSRKAWRIVPGHGMRMPGSPDVSLAELLSLAAARDILAPLAGTSYWRGISQLIERVERVATPALLEFAATHREGLVFHPRATGGKYDAATLNAVNRSIRNARELEIRYRGSADDRPRSVAIRPEAMVVYDGSVYVAAYKAPGRTVKPGDDAIRFYKLDRVVEATSTTRPFVPRRESVEALLGDSITIYRSSVAPRRYRIRIAANRARWACEKPFHPRQAVEPQPDGAVILVIERAWDEEMIPQILGLADAAEVLEPADVRTRLLDTARRIASLYEGPADAAGPAPKGARTRRKR